MNQKLFDRTMNKSIRFELPLVIAGLLAGALLTCLLWLGVPTSVVGNLAWASLFILVGAGLVVLRCYPAIPRPVLVLAVAAATSLVYLFPELFAPGCGGMPKAFANCPPECRVTVCTDWDAPGENGCDAKPPHKGCCRSYETTCEDGCSDPGDPGGGGNNPPSILGALACTQPGNGGWCKGGLSLNLSASDPQGYELLVSGDLAGELFSCPMAMGTVNCSVPLPEGTGIVTYRATSSSTLTASGSTSWALDATPPQINGSLNGSSGMNGWYVSAVNYAATATDSGSGLSSFSCTLNTAPVSCDSVSVIAEGLHTLVATAVDKAGNTSLATRNISIDTQAPSLIVGVSSIIGENGWYQAAELKASASDFTPGSGIAVFEYSLGGSAWTVFPETYTIPDGIHTLDVRVSDNAGNVTQAEQVTAKVDSLKPEIFVDLSGTSGKNGWYTSYVQVAATGSDPSTGSGVIPGSGLASLEYSLDGSGWKNYVAPLILNDGTHSLSFYAKDAAGQFRQVDQTIRVDTRVPQVGGSLKGTLGQNGWYLSNVTVIAVVSDPAPSSGVAAFTFVLDGGSSTSYTMPLTLMDGQHTLALTAEDVAGLQFSMIQTIKVDTQPPSLAVATNLPTWVQRMVTLSGTAGDLMSGLLRVEVSTDNGATWKQTATPQAWSYTWDTASGADGVHVVRIRAVDVAGQVTEKAFIAQVDNTGPRINAPDEWKAWDTVKLNASDDASGLSDVRVEIFDPHNRWPRRKMELDTGDLPMNFLWDMRFSDGTLAPAGDYDVLITAVDNLGNASHKTARIKIPWVAGFLPIPPTSTPMPSPRPTATATPVAPLPTAQATAAQVAEPPFTTFGAPESLWPVSNEGTEPFGPPPVHETLEMTSFTTWLTSFFSPPASKPTTTEFNEDPLNSPLAATQSGADLGSDILWGGAAAAAVAGITAYWMQKKREEDAARAGESANEGGEDDARARRKAQQKAKSDPGSARAAALKSAIAAVTAKEKKEWKAERYEQISQTEAYKESENKTLFMHNDLAKIKDNEANYREEQKRKIAEEGARKTAEAAAAALAANNARMENKMAAINAADESAWERAESVEAARSLAAEHNQRMEDKMARIDAEDDIAWQRAQEVMVSKAFTPGKGHGLNAPAKEGNVPIYPWWDPRGWPAAFARWTDSWSNDNEPSIPISEPPYAPTITPTIMPTITPTPILSTLPTIIPTLSPSKTPTVQTVYNIDGPMSINQIPIEFRCTLDEFNDKFKGADGKLLPLDQYYRCQLGASLFQGILTDENGWWWHDGENRGVKWQKIQTNEDVWKFALTYGLDAEGTNLRSNDPDFADKFSVAFRNKLWYLDHEMLPSYKNVIDYDSLPLGYNGRLVFLGSLEALEKRINDMENKPASEVIKTPLDGMTTYRWQTAEKTIESFVWPEPTWKCPSYLEPFDWANPYSETPPGVIDAMLKGELGQGKNQVIYMNTYSQNIKEWLYILTLEQKEYFYGHKICFP